MKFPVQGHTVNKGYGWGAHPRAAGSQVQATDHGLLSRKVPAPINRIKGKIISTRLLHSAKAKPPIDVTFSGIVIVCIDLQP